MRLLLSLLMLLLIVPEYMGPAARPLLRSPGTIVATPVALDPADPARRSVGALRFLEGWELASPDRAFGSLSAMTVTDGRFVAVSDAGGIVRFTIGGDGAFSDVSFADLAEGPGSGWGKEDRDAESLAIDPASGRLWLGFERWNAIWRYAPGFAHAERSLRPGEIRRWPENRGAEAMVRLRSGRFLIFSEGGDGPGSSREAWLVSGDPTDRAAKWLRFGYRAPKGYRITDAAELPDGRLLTLNRRISLISRISATLAIVDPALIRRNHIVEGRAIATLARPLVADNFEALAVSEERGRTIVWIASDDNFSRFQRTLLMKFALETRDDR